MLLRHATIIYTVAAATLLSTCSQVWASDGDALTQRTRILSPCTQDATCVLNAIINKRFELALKKVNRKRKPSRDDLEQALLGQLGDIKVLGVTIPTGPLEKPIEHGKSKVLKYNGQPARIPSFTIDRSKSIYRDATFCDSPGLVFKMASHVKMGSLVIGSDKLTHFFAQGYEYIEVYRQRGVRAAVAHGIGTEKGKYGLNGNGIYSYGDLSANFSGFTFWRDLTKHGCGHFAKCRNGDWMQTRRFNWLCFANPAWDEAVNPPCGPAVNQSMPYVRQLVRCGRIANVPPLAPESIPSIANSYPDWVLPCILNPKTLGGLGLVSETPVLEIGMKADNKETSVK